MRRLYETQVLSQFSQSFCEFVKMITSNQNLPFTIENNADITTAGSTAFASVAIKYKIGWPVRQRGLRNEKLEVECKAVVVMALSAIFCFI